MANKAKAAKVKTPLFVAIDTAERAQAQELIAKVAPVTGAVKLGLEFFVHHGPEGVRAIVPPDVALFLDLKLHDIPKQVAGAVRAAVMVKPYMLTLHIAGGEAMMRAACQAAKDAAKEFQVPVPKILGVTVLTSLNDDDLVMMGHLTPIANQVRRLAMLAQDVGLDGLVCSAHELRELRTLCGPKIALVAPGLRMEGEGYAVKGKDDQKRTLSPAEALASGANYLVMGRPITGAADPAQAARDILASLK